MINQVDYHVSIYKGNTLLIKTWHIGRASMEIEVLAAQARMAKGEVDRIEVFDFTIDCKGPRETAIYK